MNNTEKITYFYIEFSRSISNFLARSLYLRYVAAEGRELEKFSSLHGNSISIISFILASVCLCVSGIAIVIAFSQEFNTTLLLFCFLNFFRPLLLRKGKKCEDEKQALKAIQKERKVSILSCVKKGKIARRCVALNFTHQ
jgi:hypothetical protein